MKRRIALWGVIISAVIGMTGCSLYPDGTINGIEDGTVAIAASLEESNHIEGTLTANIDIDADVHMQDTSILKQYTVIGKECTREKVDKEAAIITNGLTAKTVEERDGKVIYTYEDGSTFLSGYDIMNYRSLDCIKREYQLYISAKDTTTLSSREEAFPLSELEDFPLKEAKKQTRELCEKLNLPLSEAEPDVYVMDAEHMTLIMDQKEQLRYYSTKQQDIDGIQGEEITWTKDDEVYYMIFNTILEGVTLSDKSMASKSKYFSENKVVVVIGRNGVKQLSVSGSMYDIKEVTELEKEVCSYEDALKVVKAEFQYVSPDNRYSITDIGLRYGVVGIEGAGVGRDIEKVVRPYWEFVISYTELEEKNGEKREVKGTKFVIVDAVSKISYKRNKTSL